MGEAQVVALLTLANHGDVSSPVVAVSGEASRLTAVVSRMH